MEDEIDAVAGVQREDDCILFLGLAEYGKNAPSSRRHTLIDLLAPPVLHSTSTRVEVAVILTLGIDDALRSKCLTGGVKVQNRRIKKAEILSRRSLSLLNLFFS